MATKLWPDDPDDARLLASVRPGGYTNPMPAPVYDLIAVGGGTAGLVAAGGAGGLGARVALVERDLLGGDCLNAGCVPSKTLIAAARAAAAVRGAKRFGVHAGPPTVDWGEVAKRVRRVRADLSPHDSAERFKREYNVDVFRGDATFTGPDELEVAGQKLRFRKAIVATGSRASVPDIPGLADAGPLTNESVFALREQPRALLVLGGGPIGCELGQAFARLGTHVCLVTSDSHLLPHDGPDAGTAVRQALEADGVTVHTDAALERVEAHAGRQRCHVRMANGRELPFDADAILVAAGRVPNVDGLSLEAAGIAFDKKRGVTVSDTLRTSNPRVFAAGDVVAGGYRFTHAADATARLALRNALFGGRGKLSSLTIPWCTFTDPEVGRVGLSRADAEKRGELVTPLRLGFDRLDRAATEGTAGFAELLLFKGTDRIAGATVVGPHAGELAGTLSVAMTNGLGLKALAATVFPYPTYTEALKKLADEHNRGRLTPLVRRLLKVGLWWGRR